jgi:hypothetical protein
MAKRRGTDNTMAKRRRTDNTMAKRRRTDNTMAKRKRTDNTMAKRRRGVPVPQSLGSCIVLSRSLFVYFLFSVAFL